MNLLRTFFLATAVFVLTQPVSMLASGQAISRVATELQFLQRAVLQRDMVALREFLDKFGNINKADAYGLTLMHYAALEGLFPAAELLQRLGASVDLTDKHGLLPFDYAEFGGHLEIKHLLLGVEPPTVDLFTAAIANAQRALERLLAEPDLDINARTADGKTVLHLSAEWGSFYATKLLIEAGADILAKDKDGNIPLELAIDASHADDANPSHALVVSVLLEAVDINAKEHKGWTALNWAVWSGNQARVRELLVKGAKVGEGCQNAIEVCLLLNDMEMFEIVRTAGGARKRQGVSGARKRQGVSGARKRQGVSGAGKRQGVGGASEVSGIDAGSSRGDTALMGVSHRGDERVVDALLKHGANTNVADMRRGYTPLRLAGENGHLAILKKLIKHDAKLDTTDSFGDTALISTSLRGHVEAVQVLIDAGADLNIAGVAGMTALMWAIYWNEKETAKALLEGGADVNILNRAYISALGWAVRRGDAAMVQMVLAYLDTTTHTGKGDLRRALLQAVKRGDTESQEILLAHLDDPEALAAARQQQSDNALRQLVKGMLIAAQDGVDKKIRFAVAEKHADAPLQWAIANKKLEVLEKMLEEPLDLDAVDANGFTPVMQTLWNDSPALETLLSHGADPNSTGIDHFPPIVSAAIFGNKEAVKTLLAWRANPDTTDTKGFTALMRAAAGGYFELVELLLLEGADLHLVSSDGYDALALAERNKHRDIAKILRAAKGEEE